MTHPTHDTFVAPPDLTILGYVWMEQGTSVHMYVLEEDGSALFDIDLRRDEETKLSRVVRDFLGTSSEIGAKAQLFYAMIGAALLGRV